MSVHTALTVSICSRISEVLGAGNNQKEYYLTDLVAIAASEGHKVASVEAAAWEMEGINSRVQLAGMEARLQNIINTRHMENGVSIINPATVRIEYDVRIGRDTLIHPFVSLHGETGGRGKLYNQSGRSYYRFRPYERRADSSVQCHYRS
jgi:bifunctional N-acetylglucosamine-1-phosphate-uridyltransferase/glucosamine-1-phosphate-acetyltransferase GlmU-like protein